MEIIKYTIAIILIIIVIINLFFKYRQSYWKRKGVMYIEPTFILGNPLPIVRRQMSYGEFAADLHKQIRSQNQKFGGFYILQHPLIMPTDPELIKSIVVKDFSTFHDRGIPIEDIGLINAHLVHLQGDRWKRSRAKLNPTFTSGKLKIMFENIVKCSCEMIDVLKEPSKTQEKIDISDVLMRYTLDCIGNCAFGLDCNSLKNPNDEIKKYGDLVIKSASKDLLISLAIYFPAVFKFFNISIVDSTVEAFFVDIVKQTINYREKNNVHRKDFMDICIKMKQNGGDPFTLLEIASAAFAFYAGGFETSKTTMTFAMYELSAHPHVQDKLREEIFEVLRCHDGEITYEALTELKYMDKVIWEVLRKYPPIPMLNRETRKAYTIPGTDITIDKGVGCWISILGMHMDPSIYPDPHKFDPERFNDEEKEKRHPFTYFPFGEGPRICIGKRFAFLQLKVGFIKLLKTYKFSLDSKTIEPIGFHPEGIFLSPKNKIWLQCIKISRK